MAVVVVAHDPTWSRKFESEAAVVSEVLGSIAVGIHHIGSTAIPSIFAKPVVDILLEVTSLVELETRAGSLEAHGYEAKGEFGIPGRRYFRKDNAAGNREYQVHAFVADSAGVARHLAFRDYLRAHPVVAEDYSRLKRQLAKQHPHDMEAYMDGKDPFIKATEQVALNWWRSLRGETAI